MIYFDNSATSRIKPNAVKLKMLAALGKFSANPGRSGHDLSIATSIEIMSVREKIRSLVGATRPENVVFTQNCSEALNIAILGTAKKNGHIIITSNEHNSVVRPVNFLSKTRGVKVGVCKCSKDGIVEAKDIEKMITPSTYMVICNHVSNVNGDYADIESIGKVCKKHNIIFLVDSAQSLGHLKIDMKKCGVDLLAIAGHKGLLGPQGIGALVVENDIYIEPIKFGGTGTNSNELEMPKELPEHLECGTVATPNILALGAGIDYVQENFDKINEAILRLSQYCCQGLLNIENIKVYTNQSNLKNGVIAFNIKGVQSTSVSDYLNSCGICVRAGLHCAPLKHKELGTGDQGVVRVSFSHHNTTTEIDQLLKALKEY